MTFRSTMMTGIAATLGTMLAAAPAFAMQAAPAAPAAAAKPPQDFKLSKPVRDAVSAAQTAIQAGDYATAKTKLAEAQAGVSTDDDRFVVASVTYQLAQSTKDAPLLQSSGQVLLATNRIDPAQQAGIYAAQAQSALDAQQFAQAETALKKVIELRPEVMDVYPSLVETQVRLNKPQDALATLDQGIQRVKAAGQPVDRQWLRRGVEIAYRAKLPAETSKLGQELVNTYPSADHWFEALARYRDGNPTMDQETRTDLMRLMRATNSLRVERLYLDYIAPLYMGYPGEADAVIKEGVAKGVLTTSSPAVKQIVSLTASKVSAARGELTAAAADARKAPNGKIALQTADSYLGFKDYAKAIEMYRVALEKGGLDNNLVNTRLGMALALSGQGPAAKTALASVTGPRADLAKYWSIYADRGAGAPASATPASAQAGSTGTPG